MNTGVGCHFLLQGIFPTQELNAGRFFTTEPPGKPIFLYAFSEYYMSSLSGRIPSMAIQILSLQNLGYSMCHTVRVLLCTLELSYKPNQSLLPEVQIIGGQGD